MSHPAGWTHVSVKLDSTLFLLYLKVLQVEKECNVGALPIPIKAVLC